MFINAIFIFKATLLCKKYHTGGAVGASSCLLIVPNENQNENIVVAVLCNSQDLSEISKFTYEISKIFSQS
jgi:hypothetical protein